MSATGGAMTILEYGFSMPLSIRKGIFPSRDAAQIACELAAALRGRNVDSTTACPPTNSRQCD
jgi:hypothetical protein